MARGRGVAMVRRPVLGRLSAHLLEAVGLAGFVLGVYVVVVLGGGALVGRTSSPSLPLSVAATTIVALAFEPVQRRVQATSSGLLSGGQSSPYDVLRRFPETATGSYPTEELPAEMAKLLGEGTGAEWTQVWLTVQGQLTLSASWPADAVAAEPPQVEPGSRDVTGDRRRAVAVRHAGTTLGVLRLQERPGSPLTSVEERLFTGLAVQAGLVLRLVGLRAELALRHEQLAVRAGQLRASRDRLIEVQDSERRRLERDIHDGAQQHLVALSVSLRLAATLAPRSPERATKVLAGQAVAAGAAIDTLVGLSRGIYPRALAEQGLVAALDAAAAVSPIPVRVDATEVPRLPTEIEAALYFCCQEASQNATKHSQARQVTVTVRVVDAAVSVTVEDDGDGFDVDLVEPGSGLTNMRDRADAVGGQLIVTSVVGRGTVVDIRVLIPQVAAVGCS
jgi:signal transduction histidine kinase